MPFEVLQDVVHNQRNMSSLVCLVVALLSGSGTTSATTRQTRLDMPPLAMLAFGFAPLPLMFW
jgi:hypothetical protein